MAENQRSGENPIGRNQDENRSTSTGRSLRGLASASKETRERVAREGGRASHGGGRKRGSSNANSSSTSGRE